MANDEHLAILKQGVDAWNAWREDRQDVKPDLVMANLRGAILGKANLSRANLSRADLSEADLSDANLSDANLTEVHLSGALLSETDLTGADLTKAVLVGAQLWIANLDRAELVEADLTFANLFAANLSVANLDSATLWGTNLSSANLDGANLNGAMLHHTSFDDVNLSQVEGLETLEHFGPSTIGIDTIYKSQGKIPHAFLRGCGVPDDVIEYFASLTGKTWEYYSCFISYSSKDEVFAQQLHDRLQGQGVRCWIAAEDMKIGDQFRTQIEEAIRRHDKLLVILSKHSVESDWVEEEVETAFEQEHKRKRTVLFPIRIDDTVMGTEQAWAATIRRTRHIGDFRRWKNHDAYQRAFDRLMRDLKADETSGTS